MSALPRRLAAEALGAFLLVGAVIGSGIMADRLSPDDGVSLIGNTIATAAMLIVLISALAPISGAHFNPVVTLVFALKREITIGAALLYVLAQCVGAFSGAIGAHVMFEQAPLQAGVQVRTGSGVWLGEALATFALVFTILAVRRARADFLPVAIGLVIAAGYWWTASTSFANPAVTLARAFTESFSGIRLVDALGFILAQIAGALGAQLLCSWLLKEEPR